MPRVASLLHPLTWAGVSLALAACGSSPSQPATPSCSWAVTSETKSFAAEGGQGTASVTTGAGCAWTAASTAPWLTITSGSSGNGSGVVQFVVSANADVAGRTGALTVGSQTIQVSQAGRPACEYTVAPSLIDLTASGGTGTVAVTTAAGCAWTATTEANWLTLTSGSSGSGSGTVSYLVSANSSTTGRETSLVVAGRSVAFRQTGRAQEPDQASCTYSVNPVEFSLDHRGRSDSQAPITLTTQDWCTWVAAADADWVHVGLREGRGSASIPFSVDQLTAEDSRQTPIRIRWTAPTAGQNVWITQTGCHYYISTPPADFGPAGGTGRIDVWNTEDVCPGGCGCPWSASSPVGWVTITSSLPRSGDDSVFFQVAANTGPARSATITVAGKPFTITQRGV